jgi:uncharacterized protein (TIGR00369 family)
VTGDLFEKIRERFYEAPFVADLGIELTHAEHDLTRSQLKVDPRHRQQDGFVHAGVVSTLADHTGGAAGWTRVAPRDSVLTVEFKVTFLRPAAGPVLECEARVIRAGKRLIFTEAEVRDPGGRAVARLTQTLAVTARTGRGDTRGP